MTWGIFILIRKVIDRYLTLRLVIASIATIQLHFSKLSVIEKNYRADLRMVFLFLLVNIDGGGE